MKEIEEMTCIFIIKDLERKNKLVRKCMRECTKIWNDFINENLKSIKEFKNKLRK